MNPIIFGLKNLEMKRLSKTKRSTLCQVIQTALIATEKQKKLYQVTISQFTGVAIVVSYIVKCVVGTHVQDVVHPNHERLEKFTQNRVKVKY